MHTLFLQNWIRQRIAGKTKIDAHELVDQFIKEVGSTRMEELGKEHARSVVQQMITKQLNTTRRGVARTETNKQRVLDAGLNPLVNLAPRRKWSEFLEFTGTTRVRVMSMTREDLLSAASIRRKRSDRELVMVIFEENLAASLEPGQKVSDVFTEDDVQEQYDQAFVSVSEMSGNDAMSVT